MPESLTGDGPQYGSARHVQVPSFVHGRALPHVGPSDLLDHGTMPHQSATVARYWTRRGSSRDWIVQGLNRLSLSHSQDTLPGAAKRVGISCGSMVSCST